MSKMWSGIQNPVKDTFSSQAKDNKPEKEKEPEEKRLPRRMLQ